ncbi:MAG: Do family serine endopeptidase [Synergistaceae bacterium]|jgi:serine protease Do|nr:Do family serine endopeptidase [Synergistaceae bacterium]
MSKSNKVLAGIIFVLLVALSLSITDTRGAFTAKSGNAATDSPAAVPNAAAGVYSQNPVARIAKECSPAVVNIDTETMVTRSPHPFANDPFFKEFFGEEMERWNRTVPMRGKGSGFIVDKKGYILTNNHVAEGADKITVTLLDGRHFEAKLVGRDPTFDLAVIQIDAANLPTLPLGDSDAAEIGEWVVAIGNPLGFENTVTAGVISGKNRTLQASNINFQGFMQTDASINPGNSGGPLINLRGEVVAINTAIVPYAQGIGFAVPVNMAKQVMTDLIEHGEVKRGWLGVMLQTMTPGFADTYRVPGSEGAIVSDIVPGSPAADAGFKRGDVIVSVDGHAVKSSQDVVLSIRNKLAGQDAVIELYRDGKKESLTVRLGDIPGKDGEPGPTRSGTGAPSSPRQSDQIGAKVSEISQELRNRYNLPSSDGLVVLSVERGTIAYELGLREGDRILEVNRREVKNVTEYERILSRNPSTVVMLIHRDGQTLFFSYKK